jgi:hypothetical protein
LIGHGLGATTTSKSSPLATPQIPIRALHASRSRNSTPRNATHHAARAPAPRAPARPAPACPPGLRSVNHSVNDGSSGLSIQEGEDPSILEKGGPIRYGSARRAKTRSADPALIEKARRYGLRQLMRESGASQHSTERFLRKERVHPGTRNKLADAVANLERDRAK